jgi:TP901 family phage tail tape measure protein
MADKIEIDILANDNFSTTFKRLNGQLTQTVTKQKLVDRGMKSSRTVITNYGKGVKKTSGAMSKMGNITNTTMLKFIGLSAVLGMTSKGFHILKEWVGKSIEEFRAFEKKMAEVSTILTGESIRSIIEVGVEIERLSVTYGQSATDLAKGMYDILSAAFSASEGMKLLEIATKASIAGVTDVSTSVDVFTSILNAWGKTVAQATTLSDQLFQTVVRGKLVFADLASAMGYIAPIAANLGVEFKEIAAALSTVTRQGQHVDMATRGLALMLQNIANLAPAAGDAATKYGVDLSDVALRVGGLEYIMKSLNVAMEEHGSHILPQMIRNMRSFRVAVALAGDVGLAGFTDDMEYLNSSAGRTEEAMAKMMNTSQMQADILSQSMQYLERDIGKAWSGFDIWAKKAKLWWGSLLAGENADAAVDAYETRANDIKIAAYAVIKAAENMQGRVDLSAIMGEVDLSEYDSLTSKVIALQEMIEKKYDFKNLKDYFAVGEKIERKVDIAFTVQKNLLGAEALKAEWDNLVIQYGLGKIPAKEITRMNQKAFEEGLGHVNFAEVIGKDASWQGLGEFFWNIGVDLSRSLGDGLEEGSAAIQGTQISAGAKYLNRLIKSMASNIETFEKEIGIFKQTQSNLAAAESDFTGAMNDANEAIQIHQENIVTLQRAMEELDEAVTTTYTTISGKEFAGKDYWQITTAGMGTALERFTRFSQQVIKYGDAMKTDYMDVIQSMVEEYEHIDTAQIDALGSLEWFNREIFNGISGIAEFDSNMEIVIDTIANYNKKVKEAKEIQSEHTKEMDESKRVMLELSLAMQRIQLKGMMRRRGLTRGEEKELKLLKIEGTKERIKNMEWELDTQEKIYASNVDNLSTSADKAMEIYNEYVDRVKWALADMKDVQDNELGKFLGIINMKEKRLLDYGILYEGEVLKMETAMASYQALMGTIAGDEALAGYYKKIYGIDAIVEAKGMMESYQEFLKTWSVTIPTGEGGSNTVTVGGSALMSTSTYTPVEPKIVKPVERIKPSDVIKQFRPDIGDIFKKMRIPGYTRGIDSVPRTGLAILHRDEEVIAAGNKTNMGGNTYQINIEVNADIKNDYDVKRLASELGATMQAKIVDKDGKSKYRMR